MQTPQQFLTRINAMFDSTFREMDEYVARYGPEGVFGEETALYRHFDADMNLLYVGISLSPLARLAGHSNRSSWFSKIWGITIERFGSRRAALYAEARAIADERPLHNRARPNPSTFLFIPGTGLEA